MRRAGAGFFSTSGGRCASVIVMAGWEYKLEVAGETVLAKPNAADPCPLEIRLNDLDGDGWVLHSCVPRGETRGYVLVLRRPRTAG